MTRDRVPRRLLPAAGVLLLMGALVLGGDMAENPRTSSGVFPRIEGRLGELSERVRLTGGFTIDPRKGTAPTTGYVVATGRSNARIEPADDFFGAGGPRSLRGYLRDHATELTAHPRLLVGAWYDPKGHRVVLSLSELVSDRDTAIRLGLAYRQRAVYDLGAQRDVPTGLSAE